MCGSARSTPGPVAPPQTECKSRIDETLERRWGEKIEALGVSTSFCHFCLPVWALSCRSTQMLCRLRRWSNLDATLLCAPFRAAPGSSLSDRAPAGRGTPFGRLLADPATVWTNLFRLTSRVSLPTRPKQLVFWHGGPMPRNPAPFASASRPTPGCQASPSDVLASVRNPVLEAPRPTPTSKNPPRPPPEPRLDCYSA